MSLQLHDGDVTFQSSFNKICFTTTGGQITAGFKPPRGKRFVVLLLGVADKDAKDCDAESMLNALGFFRKEDNGDHL